MNNISLVGRAVADAELRTVGDRMVTSFKVAVDRKRKDKDGNWLTDFFRVNVWSGMQQSGEFQSKAEKACETVKKGKWVGVKGPLYLNAYTDGEGIKRLSAEVDADEVRIYEPARSGGSEPYGDDEF